MVIIKENENNNRDEVIEKMIKTEAEIKKNVNEIKNGQKQIKNITNSNSWKRTKSIRKFLKFGRKEYVTELEQELARLHNELNATKEKVDELQLESTKLNYDRVWRLAREQRDAGTLVDYLDRVMEKKKIQDTNYNHLLHSSARLFKNERTAYKQFVYPKILSGLKVEDIPEFMIRSGLSEENISLKAASSFRASINMRMRQLQLNGSLPEMILDDKKVAYDFVNTLNVRTPWASDEVYKLANIPEKEGIVIKPIDGAGSRGVYLVYSNNDIIDVKNSRSLASWNSLKNAMQKDIASERVSEDKWFVEELIFEKKQEKVPARDIKFYCFYGKVGLILEIVRYPEIKHCWWTANGERIETGKYEESLFKGNGVTKEELNLAAKLSAEIPVPFIRIDFLRSNEGLVFGEFTPKPGNYDEFDEATDKWLGDYYIQAQGRLMKDLINDKQFTTYNELKDDTNRKD